MTLMDMARNRHVLSCRNQINPRYIDERDSSCFTLRSRRQVAADPYFIQSGESCCRDCYEQYLLENSFEREYIDDEFAYCWNPDCCYSSGSYERFEPRDRLSTYCQFSRGGYGQTRGVGLPNGNYGSLGMQGGLSMPVGYGHQTGYLGGLGSGMTGGLGGLRGIGRTGLLTSGFLGGLGTFGRGVNRTIQARLSYI